MKYRNNKTGAIICTELEINGEDWEPETAPSSSVEDKTAEEKPVRKTRKK